METVDRRATIPGSKMLPFCYLGAKAKYLNCKSHPMVQTKRREVTNSSDLCFSKTRYKNITLREKSQTEKGTFCMKR